MTMDKRISLVYASFIYTFVVISGIFGCLYFIVPAGGIFEANIFLGGICLFVAYQRHHHKWNRYFLILGAVASVTLFILHFAYIGMVYGVFVVMLLVEVLMDMAKFGIFILFLVKDTRSYLFMQLGQACVVYYENATPKQVCHHSILHGPKRYPTKGFTKLAKFWYNEFHWSHPWNLIDKYPKNSVFLPTQEERVSLRISTLSTVDSKRLFLEVFIFFKITNVPLLIQTQNDPIDALRYHAKEDLVCKLQHWTYKEFMTNRPTLRQKDFTEVYKGLINYSAKIGISITDVFCVDYYKKPQSWKTKTEEEEEKKEEEANLMNKFFNYFGYNAKKKSKKDTDRDSSSDSDSEDDSDKDSDSEHERKKRKKRSGTKDEPEPDAKEDDPINVANII